MLLQLCHKKISFIYGQDNLNINGYIYKVNDYNIFVLNNDFFKKVILDINHFDNFNTNFKYSEDKEPKHQQKILHDVAVIDFSHIILPIEIEYLYNKESALNYNDLINIIKIRNDNFFKKIKKIIGFIGTKEKLIYSISNNLICRDKIEDIFDFAFSVY